MDLEFHGVMRFYFQDDGQKVATKCIRVSSTGTTKDVILTLIEKFRPDMRMLSVPQYALYEIHENGEERKLANEEKPLLVQLNWHKDDREGRFLLRRMDQKTRLPSIDRESSNFKRKLSKREKKEKKKKEKKEKMKNDENGDKIAEKLYTELPETSFTRSISNPEAVMRRRRQQKLERKLQQFRNQDDAVGGTLKIFGESLCRDVPYRTLLLSLKDTAAYVVREILEKYGFEKEDPSIYCLVQHIVPHPIQGNMTGSMKEYYNAAAGPKEYILDDDDCPLSIDTNFPKSKGVLTFHVRRRPADYQPRKRKKKPKQTKELEQQSYQFDEFVADHMAFLLELNPDGSDITNGLPKKHFLHPNMTEVGCERSHASGTKQYLQLFGPNVQPRHCVLTNTDTIVTVTPSSRDSETYVNGMRVYETTILKHGTVVRFGKIHNFRFIDPLHEEKHCLAPDSRQLSDSFYDRTSIKDDQASIHGPAANFETTFDVDGNVETISTHSSQMIQAKPMDVDRMSRKSDDLSRNSVRMDGRTRGCDPILPAILEFKEDGEDKFLSAVIPQADTVNTQFKLAPTYALYMAARYRASTHYRPDMTPNERAHRLTALMNKVASLIQLVVQDSHNDASSLAFWMANSSELLHFLKQDRHLSAYTIDAQDLLAESVQVAFRSLVTCLQGELHRAMPAFLEDREDVNEEEGTTANVLSVLSSAMSLLRRCRVNAALTIQLFSQLFHFINMWLFNRIACESQSMYCSRLWGVRMKRRLARVEIWAEKQGLELAADCHLSRIVQAAHLLQAPKSNPEDISNISSTCFKLNSLQLRALLEKYQAVPDEPPIPQDLLANVIKVAENTADELTKSDGREVKLEEDHELQLPFLLPEDGYSCDIVRGVPAGLQEFLFPHITSNLCRMAVQPSSSGYWTIYMSDQDIGRPVGARSPSVHSHRGGNGDGGAAPVSRVNSSLPKDPEIITIKLKKSNNGMGLSIVAAKGAGQDKLGIYIKSVVKGGAADIDGRLRAGDQLLSVDGHSLVGISQEKAAEYMTRTGNLVNLEVVLQGAIYHGLSTLLSQPSPLIHRANNNTNRCHKQQSNSSPCLLEDQDTDYSSDLQKLSKVGSTECSDIQFLPLSASSHFIGENRPESIRKSKSDHAVGMAPQKQNSSPIPRCDFVVPSSHSMQGLSQQPWNCMSNSQTLKSSNESPMLLNGPRQYQGCYELTRKYSGNCLISRELRNIPRKSNSTEGLLETCIQGDTSSGHPGPRRMSERNLNQPSGDDQLYSGRIQSSKSVPTLNSAEDDPNSVPGTPVKPRSRQQEIYNPGYSRTSSTTSIPKSTAGDADGQVRPRSVNSVRHDGNFAHPAPAPTSAGPPPYCERDVMNKASQRSHPNLPIIHHQMNEERHYQNLSQYQQQQQYPPNSPARSSRPSNEDLYRINAQNMMRPQFGNQSQPVLTSMYNPNTPMPIYPSPNGNSRPISTLVSQREQEQYATLQAPPDRRYLDPANPSANKNNRFGSTPEISNFPQQPGEHGMWNPQNGPPAYDPSRPDSRHRDIIRQEAKMDEMAEEVMRQEERTRQGYLKGQPIFDPHQNRFPPQRPPPPPDQQIHPPPPPAGPKPQQRPGYPQQGIHHLPSGKSLAEYEHMKSNQMYRESPPPPPPPSNTHPLVQQRPPFNSHENHDIHNRLPQHPNMGPPMRLPPHPDKGGSVVPGISPWEREEKEKMQQRKIEEARTLRDREIQHLENLEYLTEKQEARLRTLQLEKEFQRRAEELYQDEDDEDEDEKSDHLKMKMMLKHDADMRPLDAKNEYNKLQQSVLEDESSRIIQEVTHMTPQQQWLARKQLEKQRREHHISDSHFQHRDDDKDKIIDEVSRKMEQEQAAMRELQAAREAEEKLLQEARRRQVEDHRHQGAQVSPSSQSQHPNFYNQPGRQAPAQSQSQTQYLPQGSIQATVSANKPSFDSQPDQPNNQNMQQYGPPPPQPAANVQYRSVYQSQRQSFNPSTHQSELPQTHPPVNSRQQTSPQNSALADPNQQTGSSSGTQRLDSLLMMTSKMSVNPPQPPERKSSYEITAELSPDNDFNSQNGIKKVSFSAHKETPIKYDSNGNQEYIKDSEPFMTPPSAPSNLIVGSTPGVIGAQEVYRDPRKQIQQQRLNKVNFGPGPEELSFKDKMKKFALETGQPETPRDKVKISRAQRDIESKVNGAP
ncbi:Afadin [Nymphon striatum]|nr:Afadin [Nymphon striatum]